LHLSVLCPTSLFLEIQLMLPVIDVLSFMWVATAAFAEHLGQNGPGYVPYLTRAFQPGSYGRSH
jgi:hypothetical protein